MGSDFEKRVGIFVVMLVMAAILLAPTLFPDNMPKTWVSRPITMGLDLSGGVHLVYEVESKEAVKSRLQTQAGSMRALLREAKIAAIRHRVNEKNQIEITLLSDEAAEKAKAKLEEEFKTLTFVEKSTTGGRISLIYGISDVAAEKIERDAVSQAVETLRNRVDQFGVAEPLIQKVGDKRILLQMPGIQDIQGVKKAVGSVAKLEFRLLPDAAHSSENTVTLKDRDGTPVVVEEQAMMTGDAVDSAQADSFSGQVEVTLRLTTDGARVFRKLTAENVGRKLAIILDGVVYSDPVIREAIPSGQANISGGFTFDEASRLAKVLRAGALPAPLNVLEERTVGPTLGRESIVKGVTAIVVGFAAILVFMLAYYKKSGWVAVITLALNMVFLLALLSAFGATLTLPGLAGLALTIGMAVDSNVIIFERIRDEIRNGSTRDAAVSAGFDKAFSAIADSNMTTLVSAALLYYFGTGPIKGFAVTLSIGIVTTVVCAIFVAKLMFEIMPLRGNKEGLSI